MSHSTSAPLPHDVGKVRSLRRSTTSDGFFTLCAIDHLSDFQILIDDDPSTVTYEQTVAGKHRVIDGLRESVSGFLVDPQYSYAQSVLSDAIGSDIGVMVSLEDDGYLGDATERATRMRETWSIRQAKLAGADVAKLLWFYRPESPFAAQQRDLVSALAKEAADWAMPLVVEPIWHPLAGEDPTSSEWKQARIDGIVESGRLAVELGADVLKTEFPGYLGAGGDVARAEDALAQLDAAIDVPWVILSAGVDFAEFADQVELSSKAGSSGWLAGRSIWREAGTATTDEAWNLGIELARQRLRDLTDITRAHARPYRPSLPAESVSSGWYETYHAEAARA